MTYLKKNLKIYQKFSDSSLANYSILYYNIIEPEGSLKKLFQGGSSWRIG